MLNRIWIDEQYWHGYFVKGAEFLTLKKLNFFIGVNNAGKSRFVRQVLVENQDKLYLSDECGGLGEYEEDVELLKSFYMGSTSFSGEMADNLVSILDKKCTAWKNGIIWRI